VALAWDRHGQPFRAGDVVLTGTFSLTEEWNEITQTYAVRGVAPAITVPGYGTVFFEAGRLMPNGRIVGDHTFPDDLENRHI
jgi:hypothetical protein